MCLLIFFNTRYVSLLAPPVNIYSNYSTVTNVPGYGTLSTPMLGVVSSHSPQYSPALNGGGSYHSTSASPQHMGAGYTTGREALHESVCSIQGVSGGHVYGVPNPDLLWQEDLNVMEIPREKITFVEKLGQGQFGEVSMKWKYPHPNDTIYNIVFSGLSNDTIYNIVFSGLSNDTIYNVVFSGLSNDTIYNIVFRGLSFPTFGMNRITHSIMKHELE